MKVVCPHTNLRPETKTALGQHVPARDLVYEDCTGSDSDYFAVLDRHWHAGEAFTVVEHDIVIHERVLPELNWCPEPWCAFAYELAVGVRPALGCTRFSADLLADLPDAVERTLEVVGACAPPRAWFYLDVRLEHVLNGEGYALHLHEPPVVHLNPKQKLARA